MRLILAAALMAAFTVSAHAQESAPAVVAPSTCPAIVQAPGAPDGATATEAQMRAAVTAFDAWRTTEQATLDCRRTEADALRVQAQARADEYRAAQTDNTARAAAFQAQIDIFQARPARSRR